MPRVELEELTEYKIRCLFYGPSGAGKTYLCGTAVHVPELWPVLFVDTDGGASTLRRVVEEYYPERIQVWRLDSYQDDLAMKRAIFSERTPFKTVVLDSLPAYYNWLMELHMEGQGKITFAREGFAIKRDQKFLQDYGVLLDEVLGFLREIKTKAKVHFLATASEGILEDQKTGALRISPFAVGQLKGHLPGQFQIVGRLTTEVSATASGRLNAVERRLQLMPYRDIIAKARLVDQVPFLDDPTMEKILDLLYNRGTTLEDSAIGSGADVEESEPTFDEGATKESPTQEPEEGVDNE